MFYKKFLQITEVFGKETVDKFDFWLSTLPEDEAQNITMSTVASRLEIPFPVAKMLIRYAEKVDILLKQYEIVCGNENCLFPYGVFSIEEIKNYLGKEEYCHECERSFIVSESNILVVFKRNLRPDASDKEIEKVILERLGFDDTSKKIAKNFTKADSLANNVDELYQMYYSPDESAYIKLEKLKDALDYSYRTTKEKGDAYEELVLRLFEYAKIFKATNKTRTSTNQIDCTVMSPLRSENLALSLKLSPYFLIECKNESRTPSNTYFHKLSDIISATEAQVGIIFSRMEPSKEDRELAYHQYLINKDKKQQKILISMADKDLKYVIDKKVNLLHYIDFKIMELTINGKNMDYEWFSKSDV